MSLKEWYEFVFILIKNVWQRKTFENRKNKLFFFFPRKTCLVQIFILLSQEMVKFLAVFNKIQFIKLQVKPSRNLHLKFESGTQKRESIILLDLQFTILRVGIYLQSSWKKSCWFKIFKSKCKLHLFAKKYASTSNKIVNWQNEERMILIDSRSTCGGGGNIKKFACGGTHASEKS